LLPPAYSPLPQLLIQGQLVAIGLSGVFTASATAAMLLLRRHLSAPHVKSQVFTVGAGLRVSASAAGAALAGSLTTLGGGVTVAGIGLIWFVSAVLMIAYPAKEKGSKYTDLRLLQVDNP
jgi:hypothetical protein